MGCARGGRWASPSIPLGSSTPDQEFEAARTVGAVESQPREPGSSHPFREAVKEQLGPRGMISEYLIRVETNTLWYTLGGALAIALVLEVLTGVILALRYLPDAGRAYGITTSLLEEPGWSVALNFHYWNSYVIFGLVMIHMMRVFLSGGALSCVNGVPFGSVQYLGVPRRRDAGVTRRWPGVGKLTGASARLAERGRV